MSYTKQTWATGDTVTASKLNHMEDGIAGAGGGIGALFVNAKEGFGSSILLGEFWYVKEKNGVWELEIDAAMSLAIPTNGSHMSYCLTLPPAETGLKLVFVDTAGAWSSIDFDSISGGISVNTMSVYVSSQEYTAREVTGVGYMEIAIY